MTNIIKFPANSKITETNEASPSVFGDIFRTLHLWQENGEPLFILPLSKKMIHKVPQSYWKDLIDEEIELGTNGILDPEKNFFYGIQVIRKNHRNLIELFRFDCGKKCESRQKINRYVKIFHLYENILNLVREEGIDAKKDYFLMETEETTSTPHKFLDEIISKYSYKKYEGIF